MAANILNTYGIKEVCDVTFYKINDDGTPGAPVLYLDSLKVSTMERTAENTSARGGKGNPERIIWDYNNEITLNLEDCVFSPRSMAMMFGEIDDLVELGSEAKVRKTIECGDWTSEKSEFEVLGKPYNIPSDRVYYDISGSSSSTFTNSAVYCTFEMPVAGSEITINSDSFPGTYYVTGDTFVRSEDKGEDEPFQLVFPKVKILSENTLTMEAEGDPSTFTMNVKVMTNKKNEMVKLIKYAIGAEG